MPRGRAHIYGRVCGRAGACVDGRAHGWTLAPGAERAAAPLDAGAGSSQHGRSPAIRSRVRGRTSTALLKVILPILSMPIVMMPIVMMPAMLTLAPGAQAAPPKPEVGDCYAYPRFATVKAAEARAISCRRSHNAETFYVGTLPSSLGPPRKATFAQRAAAAKPCTESAMHQAIGLGDRAIPSRFEVVVVFPTNDQWQKGARWLRCDAALLDGPAYSRLKATLATTIANAKPGTFDSCTPKVPGSKAKVASRCTKPKQNWILIAEPRIAPASSAFPGLDAVTREAKALCKKAAKDFEDPQDRWWAIWPKKAGWKAGYRLAMCFVPYSAYKSANP